MRKPNPAGRGVAVALAALLLLPSCASKSGVQTTYHDENMDFSLVQTVAVLPFKNLAGRTAASERVRDVFVAALQAEGWLYVLPPGEVARALERSPILDPSEPSAAEVVTFAKAIGADAIFSGSLLEYGELRSGSASANQITVSLRMMEAATGKVVWSAVVSKGGVDASDRLFGGGGRPMNDVTLDAVQELIRLLVKE